MHGFMQLQHPEESPCGDRSVHSERQTLGVSLGMVKSLVCQHRFSTEEHVTSSHEDMCGEARFPDQPHRSLTTQRISWLTGLENGGTPAWERRRKGSRILPCRVVLKGFT